MLGKAHDSFAYTRNSVRNARRRAAAGQAEQQERQEAAKRAMRAGPSGELAFLASADSAADAVAYAEMLASHGVAAARRPAEPAGPYALLAAAEAGGGAKAGAPVNLYVRPEQLARARALMEAFEREAPDYPGAAAAYGANRRSKAGLALFGLACFLIFVLPIAISLAVIASRVFGWGR